MGALFRYRLRSQAYLAICRRLAHVRQQGEIV